MESLFEHDCTAKVSQGGANYLYCSGHLREIGELEEFAAFFGRVAQVSNPSVDLISIPPEYQSETYEMKRLDYAIFHALQEDARRPYTQIAQDVGASARTVRKHLDDMLDNHALLFPMST